MLARTPALVDLGSLQLESGIPALRSPISSPNSHQHKTLRASPDLLAIVVVEGCDYKGPGFGAGTSRLLLRAGSSERAAAVLRRLGLVEGIGTAGMDEDARSAEAAAQMGRLIVLLAEAARMKIAEMMTAAVAEDAGRSHRAQSLESRRMESHSCVATEDPVHIASPLCLPFGHAPLVVDALVVVAVELD